MNIYEFFVSPDIAAYCQKIEHSFSPLDMAIIVARSKRSIKEKHNAYRAIISEFPDMPIHKTLHYDATDSLHNVLRELTAWEETRIKEFYLTGSDVVYLPRIWFADDSGLGERHIEVYDKCYASAEKAFRAVLKHYDIKADGIYRIGIEKDFVDTEKRFSVWVDHNGEITDIYPQEAPPIELELIFFHLPVPFEKGDLVTMEYDKKPRVLVQIPHWYKGKYSYDEFVSGKRGDGSDMLGDYYFIGQNGLLTRDHGISDLHLIRYFKGELKGQNRFLKHLSQYIMNNDESIDWLINVFCKFKAEAELEKVDSLFGGWYIGL